MISPELFEFVVPLFDRGCRESRALTAPAAPCAKKKQRTRIKQVQPRHPDFPRAMALRLIRALPGERRLLSPLSAGSLPQNRRHGRGARTTRLRRTLPTLRPALFTPDAAASIASHAQRIVT